MREEHIHTGVDQGSETVHKHSPKGKICLVWISPRGSFWQCLTTSINKHMEPTGQKVSPLQIRDKDRSIYDGVLAFIISTRKLSSCGNSLHSCFVPLSPTPTYACTFACTLTLMIVLSFSLTDTKHSTHFHRLFLLVSVKVEYLNLWSTH